MDARSRTECFSTCSEDTKDANQGHGVRAPPAEVQTHFPSCVSRRGTPKVPRGSCRPGQGPPPPLRDPAPRREVSGWVVRLQCCRGWKWWGGLQWHHPQYQTVLPRLTAQGGAGACQGARRGEELQVEGRQAGLRATPFPVSPLSTAGTPQGRNH